MDLVIWLCVLLGVSAGVCIVLVFWFCCLRWRLGFSCVIVELLFVVGLDFDCFAGLLVVVGLWLLTCVLSWLWHCCVFLGVVVNSVVGVISFCLW